MYHIRKLIPYEKLYFCNTTKPNARITHICCGRFVLIASLQQILCYFIGVTLGAVGRIRFNAEHVELYQ